MAENLTEEDKMIVAELYSEYTTLHMRIVQKAVDNILGFNLYPSADQLVSNIEHISTEEQKGLCSLVDIHETSGDLYQSIQKTLNELRLFDVSDTPPDKTAEDEKIELQRTILSDLYGEVEKMIYPKNHLHSS